MLSRFRASRPSPAILVAVVALVAAVAGTAIADPVASTSAINKKKVKKIATKQINKLAPSLSVAEAETANTANNANTLDGLESGAFYQGNCPTGNRFVAGWCIESANLAAATASTASDDCIDEGKSLPSIELLLELRSFLGITLDASGEWTNERSRDAANVPTQTTVQDDGNLSIEPITGTNAYRCMSIATRG
jgi:hypothetical protein